MQDKINTFCVHGIDGLKKQCPKCLQSTEKLFGKKLIKAINVLKDNEKVYVGK